jgi:hypothetical protein
MQISLPLNDMTISEKLLAMETLWEDLSKHNDLSSPLWHKEVLSKRDDNYSSGIDSIYDWEQAKHIIRRVSE